MGREGLGAGMSWSDGVGVAGSRGTRATCTNSRAGVGWTVSSLSLLDIDAGTVHLPGGKVRGDWEGSVKCIDGFIRWVCRGITRCCRGSQVGL